MKNDKRVSMYADKVVRLINKGLLTPDEIIDSKVKTEVDKKIKK
jgi:hypothetical protein